MVLVAENIKKILAEKGLKQNAVARKTGLKETSFHNMLHGRKVITAEDVHTISKTLEVTPNELFFFKVSDDTFPEKE